MGWVYVKNGLIYGLGQSKFKKHMGYFTNSKQPPVDESIREFSPSPTAAAVDAATMSCAYRRLPPLQVIFIFLPQPPTPDP